MEWEQRAFISFVFWCLLHMVPRSSHTVFNFSHSYFHVRGRHARGIWTDFRLRFSVLGLKWASSVSLQNSDMRLQSFVRATPSCPVLQRCLCFHAKWEWWHWWKVCRTTWNPKQRKCGLARVVTDPELESKMLDLWFLLSWDHSLVSETKGKLCIQIHTHTSRLSTSEGEAKFTSWEVQPPLKCKRRKVNLGHLNETADTVAVNVSNSVNIGTGCLSHVIITNI